MGDNFKAVIFDLDGTLLNTLEDLADSLNQVLAEEGLPTHSCQEYRFMVGNGLETLLVRALPAGLRVPAHVRPFYKKFIALYRERQVDKTRPYPGIDELLKALLDKGIHLAVLSNKSHPNTLAVVDHFFPDIFEAVLGLRPEVPAKPDPAGALEIIQTLAVGPAETLYVGDSDVDMETAVAAGLYPLGVSWGYRLRAELEAAGARAIIDEPLDLLRFVDGL